jgi:tryptophan synthase alpha chain
MEIKTNRISNAFTNSNKAFIAFITAGDPNLDTTLELLHEIERAGADLIEIGIPFSDPVAEGPVIEAANIRALQNNVTVDAVFALIGKFRSKSQLPIVLLTYLNPVYFYGYEEFLANCQKVGADGIIVPDLPFEESAEVDDIAAKYGVDLISLITPTSKERIKMIVENAKGFLYLVSSMGVTGVREEIEINLKPVIEAARKFGDIPVAVGFGVSTPEQAAELAKHADGVIVGSAIVELIEKHGEGAGDYVYEYVKSMKEGMK